MLSVKSYLGWLVLGLSLAAAPGLAVDVNFGTLILSQGFDRAKATVTGNTGGAFSLVEKVTRDRNGNICAGFSSQNPDHILVLEADFPDLTLKVNGGGHETTLVVQGPDDNIFRCSEDNSSNTNTSLHDRNWSPGTYKIWVGSAEAGETFPYRLSVE